MDLRFKQLHCFLVLARFLNFGRAAQHLYMSQPALSFQIKAMEAEIGTKLFCRDNRRVELTPAGERMVKMAEVILEEVRDYEVSIRSLNSRRMLRIHCGPAGEQCVLPAVVSRLAERRPDISVEVCNILPVDQGSALLEHRVDILMMVCPSSHPAPGMTFEDVARVPWMAVVPEDSAAARRGSISIYEFAKVPTIIPGRRYSEMFPAHLQRILVPFGLQTELIEVPMSPTLRFALVAAGKGYSLASRLISTPSSIPVQLVPFEEEIPMLNLGMGWRNDFDAKILSLVRSLLDEVLDQSLTTGAFSRNAFAAPALTS